jgi:3-hydroxyacyl-CoA dehydrogenase
MTETEASLHQEVIERAAVVGTGVIGRGWIQVFARAGCRTAIYDSDPARSAAALEWLRGDLAQDVADGLMTAAEAEARLALVRRETELGAALAGAEYVQESGPEALAAKQAIFRAMDPLAPPAAILASSTSALDINGIAEGLGGIGRCIMAHPFNPPHLLPAVEVLPAAATRPEAVERTLAVLRAVGQVPVLLRFYVPGFLANRIQAAVVREAIHLAESGVADVDGIDAVLRDGLGLRWAVMGNFGVNNTNADGGIRDYYGRYGQSYRALLADLDDRPPSFDPAMTERIGAAVDRMEGGATIAALCRWRDRVVGEIRRIKARIPHP